MTNRELFVRHFANFIVERLNAGVLTVADCTISEVSKDLESPLAEMLRLSCQYHTEDVLPYPGKRHALAKSIAGAIANHPNRIKS